MRSESHPVGICRDCGFVYAPYHFDSESLVRFYSSDAYRLLYDGPQFLEQAAARLVKGTGATILELVAQEKRPPATVLEIGCGAGWNLVDFRRAGYEVAGFEYCSSMVTLGQRYELNVRYGGVEDADGEYDVVIVNQVLEHVPEFYSFITAIERLMKPEGVLYIAVPNIDICGPGQFQNAHCHYFTPRTLAHYVGLKGLLANGIYRADKVSIHGVFSRNPGDTPSLEDEYRTVKASMSWRGTWSAAMNATHHVLTLIP